MTKHLFLVGFMGSGKSHWGEKISARTGVPFLDLDVLIEAGEGNSIPEIFARQGESGFRDLERSYLHRVAGLPASIVALGGGTPCFFDNQAVIEASGTSVYLKTAPEVLISRLEREAEQRPLLAQLDRTALHSFVHERLAARESCYLKADIVLDMAQEEKLIQERLEALIRRNK
jgi:shikimate kinase